MIVLEPVKSSNLAAMAFDSASRELHVTFLGKPDAVHRYAEVPEEKAAAMKAAPSVGAYFAREIRPHYKHIPPAPPIATA